MLRAGLKSGLCLRLRRFDGAGRLRTSGAAGKGQQGDVARAFDRDAEPALMTRTDAGHAARKNLAALLNELRQDVGALVVDEVHLLDAELADFLFAEILALSAGTATRTAWPAGTTLAAATARATFTARPTVATFAARAALALRRTFAVTTRAALSAPFARGGSWSGGWSLRLFLFL